ncbi:hypothetical protein [Desulfosarcina ovata]|uniref:hypothetical protein n=1 Tax=Desulfosarcina ovata TaxID=83564 RepID=UPI0012D32F70|nr:hypothetical protein [Desulfosarcina ovata]
MIGIIALLVLIAGFHYRMEIQQRYPEFDPTLMATGIFFLAGIIYAVIDRNIIIAFITMAVAVAIPYLRQWIVVYWPY